MALINLRNALMTGKRTPTARDYVQDGLVAMWDGIENAGWGVHDPNATAWKELISGTDCAIIGSFASNYYWAKQAFVKVSHGNGKIVFDATGKLQEAFRAATFTVEAVTSNPVNNASWQAQIVNVCQTSDLMQYARSIFARTRVESSGFMGNLSGATYHSGAGVSLASKDVIATYACVYDAGQSASYIDGEQKNSRYTAPDNTIEGVHIRLPSYSYGFRGHHHSVRLYSRALTAAEIAANCAIDKARFNLPDA